MGFMNHGIQRQHDAEDLIYPFPWGHCSLAVAASLLLELLPADWPSAHPGSVARQMNSLHFYWLHAWLVSFSSYVSWEELRREELVMSRA